MPVLLAIVWALVMVWLLMLWSNSVMPSAWTRNWSGPFAPSQLSRA